MGVDTAFIWMMRDEWLKGEGEGILASGEKMMIDEGMFLSEILQDISEALKKNSYFCSYPDFKAFYRVVERGSQPGYLMLCTLVDEDGHPSADENLEEWPECLMEAIELAIPRRGVACRYSPGQYLLLLTDMEEEECERIERRIDRIFLDTCPEANIHWEISRIAPAAFAGQERRQPPPAPARQKKKERKSPDRRKRKAKRPVYMIFLRMLAVLVALATVSYAVLYGIGRFTLETTFYTIESDKTEERIRIVGLADLHNWTFGRDNKRLVRMVADSQPDIILVAGDMVTAGESDISVVVSLCRQLVEIAPVYYSFGNHENMMVYGFDLTADFLDAQAAEINHAYGELDYSRIMALDGSLPNALRKAGVEILNNDAASLEVNGVLVDIIGFDTCAGRYFQYSSHMVEKNLLEQPEHVKVLITHRPILAQFSLPEYRSKMESPQKEQFAFDLLLCGHKHGGIIRIPGKGGMFSGVSDGSLALFEGYDSGMVSNELGNVVISRGLGNHGFLPRINNTPEIVVIDIE